MRDIHVPGGGGRGRGWRHESEYVMDGGPCGRSLGPLGEAVRFVSKLQRAFGRIWGGGILDNPRREPRDSKPMTD